MPLMALADGIVLSSGQAGLKFGGSACRYGYAIATTSHVMMTYLRSLCTRKDIVRGVCTFTIDYASVAK